MSRQQPAGGVTFATVRDLSRGLAGAEESTSYGTPAFKVGGELFVRLHQDRRSLVVRTSFEEREEMMTADPATFYITDHYLNYPLVLVSMARVHPDALRDLLRRAWRLASTEKRRKSGSRQSARARKPRPE